jgi:DivIVA domain-containing protein
LVVGAVAFGVAVLVTGADPGLAPAEPEGSSLPLPGDRPLAESDFQSLRFDTALRGYRMAQVDTALRRAAYDVGYKEELVAVLEAEVAALRAGHHDEADALREARLVASARPAAAGLDAEPPNDGKRPVNAAPAELADPAQPAQPADPADPAEAAEAAEAAQPADTAEPAEPADASASEATPVDAGTDGAAPSRVGERS